MSSASAGLVAGFCLAVIGIDLIAGHGWACLSAGVVLFAASGLMARSESTRR
jgi:hypothetical protein